MADERVYNLVERLAAALLRPAQPSAELGVRQVAEGEEFGREPEASITDLANSADVPEVIPFLGFAGDVVQQPGGVSFRMVYLDVGLQDWLLVENDGIHECLDVEDTNVPGQTRQMMWVDANAAVGIGRGPQSVEARFLTGEFTRAADFEAGLGGGTGGGTNTGDFCMARTPTCCRYPSRPPR